MEIHLVDENFALKASEMLRRAFDSREDTNAGFLLADGSMVKVHSFVSQVQAEKLSDEWSTVAALDPKDQDLVPHLIHYFYTGRVTVQRDQLDAMARLSHSLGAEDLCDLCLSHIGSSRLQDSQEFLSAMNLCLELRGAESLQDFISKQDVAFMNFMHEQDKQIIDKIGFELLSVIVKTSMHVSEDYYAKLVSSWLKGQAAASCNIEQKCSVVKQLRLDLISGNCIITVLLCDPFIKSNMPDFQQILRGKYRTAQPHSISRVVTESFHEKAKEEARASIDLTPFQEDWTLQMTNTARGDQMWLATVTGMTRAYDTSSKRWLSDNLPSCFAENRRGSAFVQLGRTLYAIGGYVDDKHHPIRDVCKLNLDSLEWTDAPHLHIARYDASAVFFGGAIYAFGGGNGKEWLSTVEKLDLGRERWKQLRTMLCARGAPVAEKLTIGPSQLVFLISLRSNQLYSFDRSEKWTERRSLPL